MSLAEVVDRVRESGDVFVTFYETAGYVRICVGNPFRWRAQQLKRFSRDRESEAAAWLHRTVLRLYPRSRYAARPSGSFLPIGKRLDRI